MLARVTFTVLSFICILTVSAQEISKYDTKVYGYFSLGNGIAGGAGLDLFDSVYNQSKIRTPVFSLGADYMIKPQFSIGFIAAYQKINVSVSDSFANFLEEGNVNRVYIGFRGLWHYGKKDNVDIYSGFKLGTVTFSTGTISGPNAGKSILERENNRTRYSLGFIPIGARFLITKDFAAHIQMSLGAPTFLSAGLNYKLQ